MAIKYKWLYERLKEIIVQNMQSGINRLPTEEELCSRFHLSRQTVRLSLSLLEAEGLIERKQGSGSYITGLSSDSSQNHIGILLPSTQEYLYPGLLFDIQNQLTANGFTCKVYETGYSSHREREILEQLVKDNIRGLIAEGCKSGLPPTNTDLYNILRETGCHILFLNNIYSDGNNFPSVIEDNRTGSELLIQHLSEKGHTAIGGLFQIDAFSGRERFLGFMDTMKKMSLSVPDDRIGWFNTDDLLLLEKNHNTDFLQHFIKKSVSSCSAIICQNDEIAYWLIRELFAVGLHVPEDIAVTSFDNSYLSDADFLSITTLTHTPHELGTRAASNMLKLLKGLPVQSQTVPWKIVIKKST